MVTTTLKSANEEQILPELLQVLTAVKQGDFSARMPLDKTGLGGKVADTLNDIIEQNQRLVKGLVRVSDGVGKKGKINQRLSLKNWGGDWETVGDSVNTLITDLVQPMTETNRVIAAVAKGDLSHQVPLEIGDRPLKGDFLKTAKLVNTMVDQLNSFSSEVTRVAREVGTDGKLGGQAKVEGVAGIWKVLTDNVNQMAGNLTDQVRNIAEVTTAVAKGDLSKKITVDVQGEIYELKTTINTMVDQLNAFSSEVTRVAREVGTEGNLGGQAKVDGVAGIWKDLTDNVNSMASNLTDQVRNIAEVTTAVAKGDLSKKITVDVQGEMLSLKDTVNTMVDQLNAFSLEVTRVAREVGTEGNLGGQAKVDGVAGIWKDLTDNVNSMASNLTTQVRGIAEVVTAVANGDLQQKLEVQAKGEIAALTQTINGMIETLAIFAQQVTTVAKEVGTKGNLGGQAQVPGASGIWRNLTDNVNQLAENLTIQVRAIAEVANAVTKGDLTQSITVQAEGEVAALKDSINQMIGNLRETTTKNEEQNWLTTNLAKFGNLLQGQRDLQTVYKLILTELSPVVSVQHGAFFLMENEGNEKVLKLVSTYAYRHRKSLSSRFHLGEGLVGQCALEKEMILLTDVPDNYIKINSGLGEATPFNIVVLPIIFNGEVTAVIELASFYAFNEINLTFLEQLTENIGVVLNTIASTMRTEELLKQSQSLTDELQHQQTELQDTNQRLEQQAKSLQASEELLKNKQEELQTANEKLEEKAELLSEQKVEVERKNLEIEQARVALEDKAEQLAQTSKYKSEFLANMSHELRTPLNSLLILAKMLAENKDKNLKPRQIDFAKTIYSAGMDLLSLINEILDLAKIESGKMAVEIEELDCQELQNYLERNFRQVAEEKGLGFRLNFDPNLPPTFQTDSQRLKQVLKNLLSNAFKFTQAGEVTLEVKAVVQGWSPDCLTLNQAHKVIAFSVHDTGIGIPPEKQQVIFEAFQQVDGTTSRKYGGTGLGLSITREIATLLGGEIRLVSRLGEGSTFTVYLPQNLVNSPSISQSNFHFSRVTHQNSQTQVEEGVSLQEFSDYKNPKVELTDDRDAIQPGDRSSVPEGYRTLLIIEDDVNFARILLDMGRERNFKGLVATRGDVGLQFAQQYQPDVIMLDIRLPVMDGWTVLSHLKQDPKTRNIPVQIISIEQEQQRGLQLGALFYLLKPVSYSALAEAFDKISAILSPHSNQTDSQLHLLVVEEDKTQYSHLAELFEKRDVRTICVETAIEAFQTLQTERVDGMVIDLALKDSLPLIQTIRQDERLVELPIIVCVAQELNPTEESTLRNLTNTIVLKDDLQRLQQEATLLLNSGESQINTQVLFNKKDTEIAKNGKEDKIPSLTVNQEQTKTTNLPPLISQPHIPNNTPENILVGKKIFIVDDDIRNVFALTSVLEMEEMEVLYAENGQDAINILQQTPDIQVVLMDIMMPGMDGYQTMEAIRQIPQFATLPIIALTAKAMKGDREKCMAAGASDYIAKPVDIDQLLAMLRHWLS